MNNIIDILVLLVLVILAFLFKDKYIDNKVDSLGEQASKLAKRDRKWK